MYDRITGKLNLGFADMGQQSLKNMRAPSARIASAAAPGRRGRARARGPSAASGTSRSPMVMVAAAVALVAVIGGVDDDAPCAAHNRSGRRRSEAGRRRTMIRELGC